MDLTSSFLIYAAIYRLAIIAVGALAIGLGYRLFIRGVMPEGSTEAGVEAGDVKLTLKNAAPGTCFALFGALIIGVMLYQTNPELLLEQRDADGVISTQRLRGDEGATLGGVSLQQSAEEIDEAIARHAGNLAEATSLAEATASIGGLAAAYVAHDGGVDTRLAAKALALTEVVYQLDPEGADNLATMARARWHLEERDEAIQAMTEAAKLDGRFAADLDRLRGGGL